MASHELDLARALATREVRVDSGRTDHRPADARPSRHIVQQSAERPMSVWREAALVVGKDLRIESRSRVALSQILPFGLIVILLFAFALDPDRGILTRAAPGLFWIAVLLAALLAIGRAFADRGAAQRPGRAAAGRPRRRGDLPGQGGAIASSSWPSS